MENVIFMDYYTFVILQVPLHHPKERTVCQNSQQKSGWVTGLYTDHATTNPYETQEYPSLAC